MSNGFWPWGLNLGRFGGLLGKFLPLLWTNQLPGGHTFSGGAQYVTDYEQIFRTAGNDEPQFPGMRLATTIADGAVLGDERWVEGNVIAGAGWTKNGDGTYTSGASLSDLYADAGLSTGQICLITCTLYDYVSGDIYATAFGGGTVGGAIIANGSYTETLTVDNKNVGFNVSSAFTGKLSDISIKQVIPTWVKDDGTNLNHPVITGGYPAFTPDRQDSTFYNLTNVVNFAGMYWNCQNDGTTAASAPVTRDGMTTDPVVTIGGTVVDGGVTWECLGHYQDSVGYKSSPVRTNSALGSCSFGEDTYWTGDGYFNPVAVNSMIEGQVAWKHTNIGTVSRARTQNIGTLVNGQNNTLSIILENVNAVAMNMRLRNLTDGTYVGALTYDWATNVPTLSAGAGTVNSVILTESGPSSGRVVRLILSSVADIDDNGDVGDILLYPTNTGANTESVIIHHVQLELDSAFATEPIITEDSTVTRPGTVLSVPSKGFLRGNDVAIDFLCIPGADGQGTVYPLSSYTDSSNLTGIFVTATTICFSKTITGVAHQAILTYSHAAGTPIYGQAFIDSVNGIGIRIRAWDGLIWGAWETWVEGADVTDAVVAATTQVGSKDNLAQFYGTIPFIQTKLTNDPKARLEANEIYNTESTFWATPATDGETIELLLSLPAGEEGVIEWGDGDTTTVTGPVIETSYTHTYTLAGDYPVKFDDEFTYLRISYVEVSGDLANLPVNLTYFLCYGSNTISGDIANLPVNLTYLSCAGSNTISDYSGKTWTTIPATLTVVPVSGGLTTAEVDQLLIDLDTDLTWSGGAITLTGTNAPRSSLSDVAVASLDNEGVTVTTSDFTTADTTNITADTTNITADTTNITADEEQ